MKTLSHALRAARTAILTLTGFACLSAAAWLQFGMTAGLAATGVSVLLVEALGEHR